MNKWKIRLGTLVLTFVLMFAFSSVSLGSPGQSQAETRAHGFAKAINENNPAELYGYLHPDIQQMIKREQFVKNFAHERSYPYLTPLYIYLDEVKLDEGMETGGAIFTVAARLPGEKMRVKLFYSDGQYYFDAFRDIADGSYIEKFKKIRGM